MNFKIDNLQYCNWSRKIFEINREAGLDAVHVTIVYHEDYKELQKRINEWNNHFKENFNLNSDNTLIGTENGDDRLEECSIITTQFESGMIQGRIGVIGPKRIPYLSLQSLLKKFTEIVQSAI